MIADRPDDYRGMIIIEWPPPGPSPHTAMPGCLLRILDAVTGTMIPTVVNADVTVRADAASRVTAELTMFADEAGEPILGRMPVLKDGEPLTGIFPFAVSEMRVRDR